MICVVGIIYSCQRCMVKLNNRDKNEKYNDVESQTNANYDTFTNVQSK